MRWSLIHLSGLIQPMVVGSFRTQKECDKRAREIVGAEGYYPEDDLLMWVTSTREGLVDTGAYPREFEREASRIPKTRRKQ